jgi:hypothetical protein
MKLQTKQGCIRVINAYAPTLAASSEEKDSFYNQLESTNREACHSERTVLLGDMNARIGADHSSWPHCIGKFGVGKINENGQRLLELCSRNNLCITNTLFPGKTHRKMSWCHPRSKTWHQLDFVIVNQKHRSEVLNTRTYHSADCDTDHSLVVSCMRLHPRPYHQQVKTSKKIDISKTNLPELNGQYRTKLEEKLESIERAQDPATYWTALKTTIHQSALDTFGLRKRQDPDWYRESQDTMIPVLEQKRKALAKHKARPTRGTLEEYHLMRSAAQKTARQCIRDYWQSLCSWIEKARDAGNIKDMYDAIKTATGPSAQTAGVLKRKDGTTIEDKGQKLARWVEHYSELYGPVGTADLDYINMLPDSTTEHHLDDRLDLAEVVSTIKGLRQIKAAGSDGIPAELLQALLKPIANHFHNLISSCWASKNVPHDFKDTKVVYKGEKRPREGW